MRLQEKAYLEKRVVRGQVYGTVKAANAARKGPGSQKPRRSGKRNAGGSSLNTTIANVTGSDAVSTKGWVSSTREETAVVKSHDGNKQWRRCLLFQDTGYPPVFAEGQRDNLKIQGLRLCVTLPLGHSIRWAVALTRNNAALGKTVEEVGNVQGAIVSHEKDVVDKWYTIPLKGIATMSHDGQAGSVTNNIYLSVEQTKTEGTAANLESKFKFVATVLTPGGDTHSHEL